MNSEEKAKDVIANAGVGCSNITWPLLKKLLDDHANEQKIACENAITNFIEVRGFSYPTTPFDARMACRNAKI